MISDADHQLRSGVAQNPLYPIAQAYPALLLNLELLFASGGDAVKTCLSIFFRRAPLRAQPAILRHAVQGGVERTLFHAQQVRRHALDVCSDGVAMHASLRSDCLEDDERERTL